MKSKCVLLIIDIQNGFVTQKARHILPAVLNLITMAKENKIPIIATKFINQPESPYIKLMHWTKLMTSPTIDLIPEVENKADYIIEKHVYSALTFIMRNLINRNGWEWFLICGIATEGCVMKTAVDLFEMDLRPFVIHDACASHDGEYFHKIGIEIIQRYIGEKQVISTSQLMDDTFNAKFKI